MLRGFFRLLGALPLLLGAPVGAWASFTVGAGSSLSFGNADVDFAEGDLQVAGTLEAGAGVLDRVRHVTVDAGATLDAGAATIRVCGNWTNFGSFAPGTSTVEFFDGCGLSGAEFAGDTTFSSIDMTTATGKEYRFAAGSQQTVVAFLALQGVLGNRLVLRSDQAGSAAFLQVQGAGSGFFVDVDDVDASSGSTIELGAFSSIGANAPGWSSSGPPGVPSAGVFALGLLFVGLLWAGRRSLVSSRI